MADIFLSYAREDQKVVRGLVGLVEAQGWTVWWDQELSPGERYRNRIKSEIDAAKVVVVAWSKDSVESDFVNDEAQLGHAQGKLIPISLDGQVPSLGFGQLHATDITAWLRSGDKPTAERLLTAIGQRIAEGPYTPSVPDRPAAARLPGGLLAGIALFIGLGALGAWQGGLFGSSVFEPIPFNPQARPSFSCERYRQMPQGSATRIPQSDAICHDVDLAKADRRMGEVYAALKGQLTGLEPNQLRNEQQEWVNVRDTACQADWIDLLPGGRLDEGRLAQLVACVRLETEKRTAVLEERLKALGGSVPAPQ